MRGRVIRFARRHAAGWAPSRLDGARGGAQPYVSPHEAEARTWTDAERAAVADRMDTQFVGSPPTVARQLAILARATAADELLITTITSDPADRERSVELLAEAWARRPSAA